MSQLLTSTTAARVRERVGEWRAEGLTVALVPTMGNLHEGHLSLGRLAREHADRVVFSIFVNPTQFAPGEDFASYPRTLEADREKLTSEHADLLFVPSDREIYPFGPEGAVRIALGDLADDLCGAHRPGHFDGVASVVCRLLNIVSPHLLVLGEKDYQQYILLARMVEDLRMPIQVVCGPTLREPDGLAMSSRNQYLTAQERRIAPALHEELQRLREALRAGEADYRRLEAAAMRALAAAGFRPDYVEVRRADDLTKPESAVPPNELRVLAAAWLGRARLIDNLRV